MAQVLELKFQAECFQWYWNSIGRHTALDQKRLIRIKNELDSHGAKTVRQRVVQLAENKATGIVPGAADFLYSTFGTCVWIECKYGVGVQSDEQIAFQLAMETLGHFYFVVTTLEQFKKIIYEYR